MPPTPNSPKTGEPSGCPGPSSSGAANRGARRRHRELGESIFHRWLPLQRHHLSPLGAGNEATVHAAPAANEAEEAAMEVSGEASASVTSPTSPSAAFLKGPSHPPISANPQRSASPSLALLHVVQRLPPPSSGALTRSQPARSLPGQWPPPIASPSCRPPNRPGGLRDGPDQGSTEKSQGRHLRCPTSGPRGAGDGLEWNDRCLLWLPTGSAWPAARMHLRGRRASLACGRCGADETLEHIICSCLVLASERCLLERRYRLLGLFTSSADHFLFPV
ncbi:hypothetical protein HPB50_015362 [Hyalomma asiaticum]|uniref:Uncharacterized protein n=1 Tax=Hyalomma asiaticum TaxID=266040 RepID=A0ACB7S054_HYAAI|nr:hypothetical protein HPB50_015362 [Hyalomma asiaticum]